jgi:phage repressor protein C with HTH and peptisase S24 domain
VNVDAAEVIADLLARGHSVRFRASGDSMHPIIRHHDHLLVEPVQTILRGDVVLALADRGLTAHRVIEIRGDAVIMRGDNAPAPDATIARGRILGRVTFAERHGKMRRVRRASSVMLLVQRALARYLSI